MVYFTALFPYVILIALLINNVQLPGAIDGITFFIVPEWDMLLSVEVRKEEDEGVEITTGLAQESRDKMNTSISVAWIFMIGTGSD